MNWIRKRNLNNMLTIGFVMNAYTFVFILVSSREKKFYFLLKKYKTNYLILLSIMFTSKTLTFIELLTTELHN